MKRKIIDKIPDVEVIPSTRTLRMDNGKAFLTLRQLTMYLVDLNIDILDNHNIQGKHLSKIGPHLTESGKTVLTKNISKLCKFWRSLEHLNDSLPLADPLKALQLYTPERRKTENPGSAWETFDIENNLETSFINEENIFQ